MDVNCNFNSLCGISLSVSGYEVDLWAVVNRTSGQHLPGLDMDIGQASKLEYASTLSVERRSRSPYWHLSHF